jgi:hypothetical protein
MSVPEGTAIFSVERPGYPRSPARLVIRVGLHVAKGPPLSLRLCPSRSFSATLVSLCLHISGCLASSAAFASCAGLFTPPLGFFLHLLVLVTVEGACGLLHTAFDLGVQVLPTFKYFPVYRPVRLPTRTG